MLAPVRDDRTVWGELCEVGLPNFEMAPTA